jgi:histidine triad (HIT) family protein
MNDTNCLFCKVVAGEVPATKVYEDENTLAFLDIKPVNPGHTLVIPKSHYVNIFEVPEEMTTKMMQTIKKIAHGIKDGLGVENMNITMNNGLHSGQTVFHAHIHLIPRHEGDGYKMWQGREYEDGEKEIVADKIKKAL